MHKLKITRIFSYINEKFKLEINDVSYISFFVFRRVFDFSRKILNFRNLISSYIHGSKSEGRRRSIMKSMVSLTLSLLFFLFCHLYLWHITQQGLTTKKISLHPKKNFHKNYFILSLDAFAEFFLCVK